MQRTEISGVPVLWEEGLAPFTAALVFGVGARHETFRSVGVTHLVEHLVMSTLPKSALDRNATVDLDTTVFYATGRVEDVVEYVNRVCAAIFDLPLDRLDREVGVLRAEEGHAEHPAVALSLRARYGFKAQGLAGTTGAGLRTLTRDHVVEHARRYFTRRNVYLVLSGEPPQGLDLHLPDGPAVDLPVVPHVDLRLPGRIHGEPLALAALSGIVTSSSDVSSTSLSAAILRERLEDELRGHLGISYDIGSGGASIRVGESMAVVWADGHEDQWQTVVDTMWSALTGLAEDGPTAAELDHAHAMAQADLEDPRGIVGWLVFQATRALYGQEPRTRSQQLELDRRLDAESVRACAKQILRTALVLVPVPTVDLAGVPDITDDDLPSGTPMDGRIYRRKLWAFAPRDLAVRIGEEGLSITAAGTTAHLAWANTVGVARAEGLRGLIADDGRMLPVMAKHLRGGEELLDSIDEQAGPLLFESDPDDILA